MVGLMLFMSVIGIYYTFQSAFSEEHAGLEDLISDAKQISNELMSPGYPDPWTTSNVQRIGLTNSTPRIVISKVQNFSALDYTTSRSLFHTGYDYAVYFRQGTRNVTLPNNQNFIGREPANATDVVTTLRFVIYNSTITQMEVRVWR
ncbi:MAG TPA: hypothetical protein VLJ21_03010 [Candidatus Binatia bacterium]|nr:hypothetical protein [Candidatus Binatia bacterium]